MELAEVATQPQQDERMSLVLQNVTLQVELVFKSILQKSQSGWEPRYPRFKGKSGYDSITSCGLPGAGLA